MHKDDTVDRVRDQVEERGWTNLGTAYPLSKAAFEAGAR